LNRDGKLIFKEERKEKDDQPVLILGSAPTKWSLLKGFIPLSILFLWFVYNSPDTLGGFQLFFIAFICVSIFLQWRKSAQLEVYKNRFVISYPHKFFLNTKREYTSKNLISLNYRDLEDGTSIELTHYDKGEISSHTLDVYTDFDSFFDFFKFQFETNHVAIKHNGEIFIPEKAPVVEERPVWKKILNVR
jgi:hypothetical protein